MAKTNYERIGEGLNILKEGLISFAERECLCYLGEDPLLKPFVFSHLK